MIYILFLFFLARPYICSSWVRENRYNNNKPFVFTNDGVFILFWSTREKCQSHDNKSDLHFICKSTVRRTATRYIFYKYLVTYFLTVVSRYYVEGACNTFLFKNHCNFWLNNSSMYIAYIRVIGLNMNQIIIYIFTISYFNTMHNTLSWLNSSRTCE